MRAGAYVFAGVMIAALVTASGSAQSKETIPAANGVQGQQMPGLQIEYPEFKPIPVPFPLDGKFSRISSLEFRAPEAMTAEDRTVADGAQIEIARRAELAGLHMSEDPAGWGYEQAVCPAFPEHIILEYSRLNGPGDVTLFSAVVPRGSAGHVRVIPVRRRGYWLWTPASSNALTLNDFNHMVVEGGLSPDWLTLSLCYTALAAGHVRAVLVPELRGPDTFPMIEAAILTADSKKSGAEVRIVNMTAPKPKGEWVFDYDGVGHLKRVRKVEPELLNAVAVQGIADPTQVKGVPTAAP